MAKATSSKTTAAQKTGGQGPSAKDTNLAWFPLNRLHFNPQNPRFADDTEEASDSQLLDRIVKRFGVEDLLSSLAFNGT